MCEFALAALAFGLHICMRMRLLQYMRLRCYTYI
jgi:hypothetical protein